MTTQVLITAKGLVQGVGYRYYVSGKARALNLTGYVQNLPDGDVEILAEGEKAVLEKLIETVRVGPPAAVVKDLLIEWHLATDSYKNFEYR